MNVVQYCATLNQKSVKSGIQSKPNYHFAAAHIVMWLLVLSIAVLLLGVWVYNSNKQNNIAIADDSVTYGGGDGTSEESAFEISTLAQMQKLASEVSGGIDYAGKYFKLVSNITLPSDWTGIGSYNNTACFSDSTTDHKVKPFRGNFDGNDFVITYNNSKQGIFTTIGGDASIKNIETKGAILVVEQSTSSNNLQDIMRPAVNAPSPGSYDITALYVGSIVGMINDSTRGNSIINNCTTNNSIKISITGYDYKGIGGIIGAIVSSNISDPTIIDCKNTGDIESDGSDSAGVAGLVGRMFWGEVKIQSSCNLGNITTTSASETGGLVGNGNAYRGNINISNSYNNGTITATGGDVGGLIGYLMVDPKLSIVNCYNCGTVVSKGTTNENVGGLIGYARMWWEITSATIGNCYNLGQIIYNTSTAAAGGIIGCVYTYEKGVDLINIFNVCTISGNSESEKVGGIIGYIKKDNDGGGVSTLKNCYTSNTYSIIGASDDSSLVSATSCTNGVDESIFKNKNVFQTSAGDVGSFVSGGTTYSWNSEYVWDFTNEWIIISSVNNGYPTLQAFNKITEVTITLRYKTNNKNDVFIYIFDSEQTVIRQLVLTGTSGSEEQTTFIMDINKEFSIMVYQSLYMTTTIDGVNQTSKSFLATENFEIVLDISLPAFNVGNWVIV